MKENICTIPINDIFRDTDGCPFCRMYKILQERYIEFITGSAMMSPDIRVQTNEKGFCDKHFKMMYDTGNKLPNALILETHLQHIIDNCMPQKEKSKPDKKQLQKIAQLKKSCFVCDKIEHDMYHLLSTVFVQWQRDEEFKKIFRSQDYICLNHYAFVMNTASAKGGIPSKMIASFSEDTARLCKGYLESLKGDITHFCSMFDYRNCGGDWGNSKDAIERSIKFLEKNNG